MKSVKLLDNSDMKISEALTDRDEDHEGDNADDRR